MTTRLDVDALYVALDRKRRAERITWREVGRRCGLDNQPSLMTRLGRGHAPSADNLVRLLAWLGTTDLCPFVRSEEPRTDA